MPHRGAEQASVYGFVTHLTAAGGAVEELEILRDSYSDAVRNRERPDPADQRELRHPVRQLRRAARVRLHPGGAAQQEPGHALPPFRLRALQQPASQVLHRRRGRPQGLAPGALPGDARAEQEPRGGAAGAHLRQLQEPSRGEGAHLHRARHHPAQDGRAAAALPGLPRQAHRAGQSGPVLRHPGPVPAEREALPRLPGRPAVPGSGRVQEGQRHPGARHRRPGALRVRAAAFQLPAGERPGVPFQLRAGPRHDAPGGSVPLRRGRVRDPAHPPGQTDGRGRGLAEDHRSHPAALPPAGGG